MVCFLAYVLWKTLGQWMRRSGLGDAPRTVVEELAKLKSGDVYQVAEVVRNLAARNRDASLPAAERTMYERARVNLISEISPALKVAAEAAEEYLDEALAKGVGARGLRGILEEVMLDIMYDLPEQPEGTVYTIDEKVVSGVRDLFQMPTTKSA